MNQRTHPIVDPILAVLAMLMVLAPALSGGCAVVYAPRAERLSLYEHGQTAHLMAITQDIQPRVADKLTGAVGAQVEGNNVLSPSGNNVGSPNTKVGIK